MYASPFLEHTRLRQTTLSDPRWDVLGATAQGMKRPWYEKPLETDKQCSTRAAEAPNDLQDVDISLEDMGNVIILAGC